MLNFYMRVSGHGFNFNIYNTNLFLKIKFKYIYIIIFSIGMMIYLFTLKYVLGHKCMKVSDVCMFVV